jgi:Pathogen effector
MAFMKTKPFLLFALMVLITAVSCLPATDVTELVESFATRGDCAASGFPPSERDDHYCVVETSPSGERYPVYVNANLNITKDISKRWGVTAGPPQLSCLNYSWACPNVDSASNDDCMKVKDYVAANLQGILVFDQNEVKQTHWIQIANVGSCTFAIGILPGVDVTAAINVGSQDIVALILAAATICNKSSYKASGQMSCQGQVPDMSVGWTITSSAEFVNGQSAGHGLTPDGCGSDNVAPGHCSKKKSTKFGPGFNKSPRYLVT